MLVLKHCFISSLVDSDTDIRVVTTVRVVTGEESVLHLPCCGAVLLLVLMVITGSVTQVLVQRVMVGVVVMLVPKQWG